MNKAKDYGFVQLQAETLDRLFIVSDERPHVGGAIKENETAVTQRTLSLLGIDVSAAGEATYIYQQ